jgi:hypothetical protein
MPIVRPLALTPARFVALAGAFVLLAGCPSPDPDKKFDRFVDETEDEREDAANVKMDQGGSLADINGTFLFALASFLDPEKPLQFFATVTFEPTADGGIAQMSLQPLSLDMGATTTPRQPVGDPLVIPDVQIDASGAFLINIDEMVTLPGASNPITQSDIVTSSLILTGTIQSADLFCGTVDGMVEAPITTPLTGSNFGAERVTGLDALPTTIIGACPAGGGGESGSESGSGSGSSTGG